jgi:hypothetical protein
MRKFMELVPKGVKVAAVVWMCAIVVLGTVAGGMFLQDSVIVGRHMPVVAGAAIGAAGGLAMGLFCAAWLLCVGYVYADAKRRGMRPLLWALIAALFPHLFGFLLYFALRQPLAPKCPQCGQPVTLDQRFCSWCGTAGPAVGGTSAAAGAGPVATA